MTAGPAGLNCAFAIFSTTEINFRSGSSEFAKSTLHWLVSVKGLPRRADTRWGIWLQHTLRKASRSERTSDARETPSRDAAKTPGKMLHEVRPLFRHIAPWWDAKKKQKNVSHTFHGLYTPARHGRVSGTETVAGQKKSQSETIERSRRP